MLHFKILALLQSQGATNIEEGTPVRGVGDINQENQDLI